MGAPSDNIGSQLQSTLSTQSVPEVADVYARFAALVAIAEEHFDRELGGKLLLFGALDPTGAAVSLAANIAGAPAMGVDADTERLRRGMRYGFCDFVVKGLDEALRILKNEIRKKQPVSVCLQGDLAAVLREAVERGLQPDLLAISEVSEAGEGLVQRGALKVDEYLGTGAPMLGITWSAQSAPALWLSKVDAIAAEVLPIGDERLRWLKLAPRYLGRAMAKEHYLQMSAQEYDEFEKLVAQAGAPGGIGTEITIQRRELSPR